MSKFRRSFAAKRKFLSLAGSFGRGNLKLPLSEYRNFLLILNQPALGGAFHATPLVSALRAVLPDARIAVAASGFSTELFAGNPDIERIVEIPDPELDFRGAVSALRGARIFDGEPYLALQTLGKVSAEVRAAASHSGADVFTPTGVHALVTRDRRLSTVANYLRLIERLGYGPQLEQALRSNPALQQPRIFFTEQHLAAARALLQEHRTDVSKAIAIFVTQGRPTPLREWQAERWRAVASWLHQSFDMQIVFTGTKAESAAIDDLRGPLPFATFSLAGRTGRVQELSALLSLAQIALAIDTGPMHLALAVGLPTVVIAPAGAPPIEWLPLRHPRARVLWHADGPSLGGYDLHGDLLPQEVQESLQELLEVCPPQSRRSVR